MAKYPQEWKDAAFKILCEIRAELHASVGYKRMGWDPVRKLIMLHNEENGEDRRLIRQNLEDWEADGKISDEKFELVDDYLRRIAIEKHDSRALALVKKWRFEKAAECLSTLYVRRVLPGSKTGHILRPTPWIIHFEPGDGHWFKAMFIRGIRTHSGVTEVIVGYLPNTFENTKLQDGLDAVFYEGFMIPIGYEADPFVDGSYLSAIKLIRAEFRGLEEIGLADGYMTYVPHSGEKRRSSVLDDVFLYPSSSLLNPCRDALALSIHDRNYEIYSQVEENVDIILTQMIDQFYKGYVF